MLENTILRRAKSDDNLQMYSENQSPIENKRQFSFLLYFQILNDYKKKLTGRISKKFGIYKIYLSNNLILYSH